MPTTPLEVPAAHSDSYRGAYEPQTAADPFEPSDTYYGSSPEAYASRQMPSATEGSHAGSQQAGPVNAVPSAQPAYAAAVVQQAKPSGVKTFFIAFLGALLACAVALGAYTFMNKGNAESTAAPKESASISESESASGIALGSQTPSEVAGGSDSVTLAEAVASKVTPSVGCIYVYSAPQSFYGFMGAAQQSDSESLEQSSLGSGIVLTEDGYILTNYHVIENSDAVKINIEGTEYDAEIVGTDASSDLAVIKAKDASGLTPADIGDSDSLRVGEWVMTVGSPFGLESSVATGVVSATSRSRIVEDEYSNMYGYGYGTTEPTLYPNMIQTDAAINPGNSGGALVDADGKVIGVNTLIASYSGNYSGVGFAIPINYAINIADQIIAGKTPTHAKLGVSLTTVNSSVAKRYNLATDSGAYITEVVADSGADAAGLKAGDIVTAFDGEAVTNSTDLTLDIREHNPGDTVTITVNRNGETVEVQATLGSDENDLAAQIQQDQQQEQQGQDEGMPGFNFNGRDLSYEDLLELLGNL